MNSARRDVIARSLSVGRSRWAALVVLLGGAAGLSGLAGDIAGKKATKKTRKKPLRVNQFGCVNVGGQCRGNGANCCSGICDGEEAQKGAKDKSTCAAHDEGVASAGRPVPAVRAWPSPSRAAPEGPVRITLAKVSATATVAKATSAAQRWTVAWVPLCLSQVWETGVC